MDDTLIVTVFVVIDELLQACDHHDHPLTHVPDAEVLTVAVVAAAAFQNHHERALQVLLRLGYLSGHLSVSRFNRRLHALGWWFDELLGVIAAVFTRHEVLFAIDSFPVPACERARASAAARCVARSITATSRPNGAFSMAGDSIWS